jgi:hypothetical protein
VTALHLAQHSDRPQPRYGTQHWQDLALPGRQRVGPATTARRLCLRGHPESRIEPGSGAGAEACSGRGRPPGVGSVEVHVQSRLLVGDVCAGHGRLSSGKLRTAIPARRHGVAGSSPWGTEPTRRSAGGRAKPDRRLTCASLILIVAHCHPDCRCASASSIPQIFGFSCELSIPR